MEQARHDRAGHGRGARKIAQRRPHRRRLGRSPRGEVIGRTTAGPERGPVETGCIPLLALLSVPAPPDVDDGRVHPPDVVDVDVEPRAAARQQVSQEDVGAGDELAQDLVPFGRAPVEADAAFTPVGLLHERFERLAAHAQVGDDQIALRVGVLGVLYLDDVGAPVRQNGARGRDEQVGGQFDDADTFENLHRAGLQDSGRGGSAEVTMGLGIR